MMPPINLPRWISENSEKLQPPVNNYCIYDYSDLTVMVVGGPNERTDYHINHTEELFYQHKGAMLLKIVENGAFKDIHILEGDIFLLPRSIPHNPVRFENTVGLVVELKRPAGVLDSLRWYCVCGEICYEESFYCTDLGVQLKPVILRYQGSEELRTCKKCGHLNK